MLNQLKLKTKLLHNNDITASNADFACENLRSKRFTMFGGKERFLVPSRVACNGTRRTHPFLRVFLSFFLFFFSGNYVFPVVARAWNRVACSPMRKLLRIHLGVHNAHRWRRFLFAILRTKIWWTVCILSSFCLRNREKTDILFVKI